MPVFQVTRAAAFFSASAAMYGTATGSCSAGVLQLDHGESLQIAYQQTALTESVEYCFQKQWERQEDPADGTGNWRRAITHSLGGFPETTLVLETIHTASNKFTYRLYHSGGSFDVTGTTEYAYATKHDRLVTMDGTNWKVYVDTGSGWVEEISGANTAKSATSTATWVLRSDGEVSDDTTYSTKCEVTLIGSADAFSSIPENGSDITAIGGLLDGESATYQDFTAGADGGSGDGNPHNNNVDDYEVGAADGNTTHDRHPATNGATKQQAYKTTTLSPTGDQNVVATFASTKVGVGGKSATSEIFIYDETTQAFGPTLQPTTGYSVQRKLFETAPDGTPWADFSDWDKIELGIRSITVSGAGNENVYASALFHEVVQIVLPVVGNPGDPQNFRRQVIH